jgi:uncharacterized protein YdhG (YjbR/CyaY superfamily)
MSAAEVDAYLERLDEPKRSTLVHLRRDILDVVPEAEQGISYGMPAFRLGGKVIAGFAAFKQHLSSAGALHFPIDRPLPSSLVAKLVGVRLRQAFPPH